MDEAMGRRTVGGLLVTKAGSILVFREESPRHKATSCCTRLGCSSKLSPNKDRKMCRTANEAAAPQGSPVFRKCNRMPPQGVDVFGGTTSRNATSTSGATDNRPRRKENAGRDLLARLKQRVNISRKRSSSVRSSPLSPNASITASSSSRQSISTSLRRPASRMRKDGDRNGGSVRVPRDGTRVDVGRNDAGHDPSGWFLSGRLFRDGRRLQQGGPIYSVEDSLDDSNEYWRFDMNGGEEAEDYYALNDRHRAMRMDIDDMSYEELLVLEERIGTVSTLSDAALSKCLKRSRYVPATSSSHEDADIECIICHDEYLSVVEVAEMVCKHYYHTTCIQEWLRQKKLVPDLQICGFHRQIIGLYYCSRMNYSLNIIPSLISSTYTQNGKNQPKEAGE